MLIFLYIPLIILAFSLYRKKHYWILILMFLALVVYIKKDVDFDDYNAVYKYIGNGNRYLDAGIGWYYLCLIGNKIHLTYQGLKSLIFFISGILIHKTISKYIKNKNFISEIFALYLIFPALLDGVQIRFLLSESIFIFSFPLLTDKKFYKYILYVLLILIAYSIHSSAIFYLLFLFIPVLNKFRKYYPYLVLGLTLVAFFGRSILYNFISLFINDLRISRYLQSSDGASLSGIIVYCITLFGFSYLLNKLRENYLLNKGANIITLDTILGISYMMWLVLPLTMFDTNFFRIQRPLWPLLYMSFYIVYLDCGKYIRIGRRYLVNNRQLIILLAILGNYVFICFYSFYIIQQFLF